MVPLSKFYQMVAPACPGAPEFAIAFEVRSAAIEFCEKTLYHRRTLDAVSTVVGQAVYSLVFLGDMVTLGDDAAVDISDVVTLSPGATTAGNAETMEKVLSVKVDGEPMRILTPDMLDEIKEQTTSGSPKCALRDGPMRIRLYPAPSVAGKAIVVRAAMRPAQEAAEIDDDLFERYARAIADGAIARLASLPNKTFSVDPTVAANAAARFSNAIVEAKEKAFLNDSRAVRRSRPIKWC